MKMKWQLCGKPEERWWYQDWHHRYTPYEWKLRWDNNPINYIRDHCK